MLMGEFEQGSFKRVGSNRSVKCAINIVPSIKILT